MGQINRTNFGIAKIAHIPNAQVLTLPTTEVTLVAGVAGRVWLPQFVAVYLFPRVADYTNIDGAVTFTLRLGNAANVTTTLALAPATILAGVDASRTIQQTVCNLVNDDFTTLSGAALVLHCTNAAAGNFTGGDAGNVLNVKVFYSAIKLS